MKFTLAAKIFLPILSILLFLIATEGALHLLDINAHPRSGQFTVNRAPDFPEVFLKDKNLFWKFRPGQTVTSEFFKGQTYTINSNGFRGPDLNNQPEKPLIAIIGNSTSFGWGVNFDETFGEHLRNMMLWTLPDGLDVFNFSVPGYSSHQGIVNYRENVAQYRPTILIINFAWNDQWLAARGVPDKDIIMPSESIIALQNFFGQFRFYRVLTGLFVSAAPTPIDLSTEDGIRRVSLEDYAANLTTLITEARANGSWPILLTSPIPSLELYFDGAADSFLHQLHRQYNEIVRTVAARENTGLVDLAAVFDIHDNLFDDAEADPFHYNAYGHLIAAQEMLQVFVEYGYLEAIKELNEN